MVKKVNAQMKMPFLILKYHILIVGFLCMFKLLCDTTRIHEGASIWILTQYIIKELANFFKNRLFATD